MDVTLVDPDFEADDTVNGERMIYMVMEIGVEGVRRDVVMLEDCMTGC